MSAYQLAIVAAGIFFLNALLSGIWKYLEIAASEDGQAHPYIDIAHRASLMYAFAAILIAVFIEISELPGAVEFIAALAMLVYFALANGVRSVGVLWGYGSLEELVKAGAERLCESPQTLAECMR